MTKIVQLLTLPLFVCIALGSFSCSSDDPDTDPVTEFTVENKTFAFTSGEQSDVIKVTAVNVDWTAEVAQEHKTWLSIEEDQDNGRITVFVTENPDPKEREGEFTVTPNSTEYDAVTVKVVQNGVLSLIVNPDHLEFDALDGEAQYVNVIAPEGVSWSIREVSASWINASKDGNRVRVTSSSNTSVNEVSGTFKVVTDNDDIEPKTVTVIMAGKPELAPAKTEVTFTIDNNQREEIAVTAHNVDWTVAIENNAPWLRATRNGENLVLEVVQANETGAPRLANVVLYPDDTRLESVTVNVTQRGRPVLEVDQYEVNLNYDDTQSVVIEVNANEVDWEIEYDERLTWITIVPDYVENTITLTAENNEVGEIRDILLKVVDKDEKLDDAEIIITQKNRINMVAKVLVGNLMAPMTEEMLQAYGYQLAFGMGTDDALTVVDNTSLLFGQDTGTILNVRLINSEFTGDKFAPRMKAGTYNIADSGNQDMGVNTWSGGKVRKDPYTGETRENNTRLQEGTITVAYSGDNVRIDIDAVMADGKPFVGYYDGPMPIFGANFTNPWNTYKRNITLPNFTRAVAFNKGLAYNSYNPRVNTHNIWHIYLMNGDVEVAPTDQELETITGAGEVALICVTLPVSQPNDGLPTGTFELATSLWDLEDFRDNTYALGGVIPTSRTWRGSWFFEVDSAKSWRHLDEFPMKDGTITINGSGGNYTIAIDANDYGFSEVTEIDQGTTLSAWGVAEVDYTIKGSFSGSINVM